MRLPKDFQVKVGNSQASLIKIKGGGHAEAVETELNGLQCLLGNMNAEVRLFLLNPEIKFSYPLLLSLNYQST